MSNLKGISPTRKDSKSEIEQRLRNIPWKAGRERTPTREKSVMEVLERA